MANTTYHVALAIARTREGDLVVEDPVEARAQRPPLGGQIASGKVGAIAFSRMCDLDVGEYGDAVPIPANSARAPSRPLLLRTQFAPTRSKRECAIYCLSDRDYSPLPPPGRQF
jgi:hypothetical protein